MYHPSLQMLSVIVWERLIVNGRNSTGVQGVGPIQHHQQLDPRWARLRESVSLPHYPAPTHSRYHPRNAPIVPPLAVQIRKQSTGPGSQKPIADRADPTMSDYLEKIPGHLVMRNGGSNGPTRLNPYAPRGEPRSRCDLVTSVLLQQQATTASLNVLLLCDVATSYNTTPNPPAHTTFVPSLWMSDEYMSL